MNTKKYLVNPADMPIIAKRLKESLERDISDFRELSTHFNRKFLAAFNQLIIQAEPSSEITPINPTELQLAIGQLLVKINSCLEAQAIQLADELADALTKITLEEDLEKKIATIDQLVTLLERNEYLFAEETLDPIWFVDLRNLAHSFTPETAEMATPLNMAPVYDQLWDHMQQICVAGQALYKHTDAGRARQYSFKQLKDKWLRSNDTANAA